MATLEGLRGGGGGELVFDQPGINGDEEEEDSAAVSSAVTLTIRVIAEVRCTLLHVLHIFRFYSVFWPSMEKWASASTTVRTLLCTI